MKNVNHLLGVDQALRKRLNQQLMLFAGYRIGAINIDLVQEQNNESVRKKSFLQKLFLTEYA